MPALTKVFRSDGSYWYTDTTPLDALEESFKDDGYKINFSIKNSRICELHLA